MATTYTAHASAEFVISVECESCDHHYWWRQNLRASGRSTSRLAAQQSAASQLEKKIAEKRENNDFGVRRCPKCKYLQSWMVSASAGAAMQWVKRIGLTLLWVAALAALFGIFPSLEQAGSGSVWQGTFFLILVALLLVVAAPTVAAYFLASRRSANVGVEDPGRTRQPQVGMGMTLAAAHASVGSAYGTAGNLQRGMVHYEEAIRVGPNFPGGYLGRGLGRLSLGQAVQGVGDLQRYVQLAGRNADPKVVALLAQLAAGPRTPPTGKPPSTA